MCVWRSMNSLDNETDQMTPDIIEQINTVCKIFMIKQGQRLLYVLWFLITKFHMNR